MKCIICGKEIEKSHYTNAVLCSSECFSVNHWNECLDDTAIIVNGECYHDGGKMPKGHIGPMGHGGKLFKIKMNNGEVIETNNLWYNGEVPKDRNVKDNAVFITDHPTEMTIDDKIEYWHTHETGNSLREFLGMTEQEYLDFALGKQTEVKGSVNDVKCKDCEYLMFSDCYGECSKAHKGIVSPNDSCGNGKRKGCE